LTGAVGGVFGAVFLVVAGVGVTLSAFQKWGVDEKGAGEAAATGLPPGVGAAGGGERGVGAAGGAVGGGVNGLGGGDAGARGSSHAPARV
jgi:hypothetical protein